MNLETIIDTPLKAFMVHGESIAEPYHQVLFRFPNGYGASVLTGYGTGVELAKGFFYDEHNPDEVGYMLTEEPIKNLDRYELNKLLYNIKDGAV